MDGMVGYLIVIVFLLGFISFLEIRNYLERKTLYDRLMSRDFSEWAGWDHERIKARRAGTEVNKEGLIPL
jgi:hypothetical protein